MHDTAELRARCMAAFRAGLAAADPGDATRLALAGDGLPRPGPGGRLCLAAIGKAAVGMARPAMAALSPERTLVVTNDGNDAPLPGAEVMVAGHPVPDAQGAAAADALEAMVRPLARADVLVVLVSGGASAMLPAPRDGLTLADEVAVNRLALASGADITETNILRQAVSRLKGGGLARIAAPAQVVALILSDVVGDDPRVVASGPTAAPIADREAARAVARSLGIWDDLPAGVRRLLSAPERPAPPTQADNRVIGGNAASVAAMAAATPGARIHGAPLTGDVNGAAEAVLSHFDEPGGIMLFGGETTVRLRGHGRGGRNQELALRVAMQGAGQGRDFAFLSGGTDGRDGPTDAAGGLVDAATCARIAAAGGDAAALLAENDSNRALALSNDLLMTGPTGTNVADLQVLALAPRGC
jgi:hydroxypyruvate reductase